MGIFEDQVNSDSAAYLDADAAFGETVVYTPKGQSPRTINAYVHRTPPQRLAGLNQVAGNVTMVWVANSDTSGVSSVNVGGDTIRFAGRVGGPVQTYTVQSVESQDAGIWKLRVV